MATLSRCLREPALRYPVLVLESDDWGAVAPSQVAEHALALDRLRQLLLRFRDRSGRPAVMTIGLVSAIIDRDVWRREGRYVRLTLAEPSQRAVVDSLRAGLDAGVFVLQWHGLEHYWPAALLAARHQPQVAGWLEADVLTEDLPPPLQSRWVDASNGKSRPLDPEEIREAIEEERHVLLATFGFVPQVAVPNTFVWDDNVEAAWAEAGVEFLITCGRRFYGRDAQGRLEPADDVYHNGQRARSGLICLVRDAYFEQHRGHGPAHLREALEVRLRQARPCLIETHRINYVGEIATRSLEVLEQALADVVAAYPDLRFMSPQELGRAFRVRDAAWVQRPTLRHLMARLRWIR